MFLFAGSSLKACFRHSHFCTAVPHTTCPHGTRAARHGFIRSFEGGVQGGRRCRAAAFGLEEALRFVRQVRQERRSYPGKVQRARAWGVTPGMVGYIRRAFVLHLCDIVDPSFRFPDTAVKPTLANPTNVQPTVEPVLMGSLTHVHCVCFTSIAIGGRSGEPPREERSQGCRKGRG